MVNILDIIDEVHLTPKNSTELAGPCPKCGGRDRFIVRPDDDYCWCRKCEYWANTDKYAHDFNKMHLLEEGAIMPIKLKKIPKTPDKAKVYAHQRHVVTETLDRALPYYSKFGLNEDTLIYFGVSDAHNRPGQDEYQGFYIPNLSWWHSLHFDAFVCCGGTYRIDPEFAKNTTVTWPKYLNEKNQNGVGYFHNYLLSTPDNARIGPFLDHCFIVEGQKDVMLLTQMGYNAVAFKGDNAWLYYSDVVFQRVASPIILADNDDGAGDNIALRVQHGIKRGNIYKIDGAKQISDYVELHGYQAGLDYMKGKFSWVGKGLVQIS